MNTVKDEVRIIWLDSKTWSNLWIGELEFEFNLPECKTVGIILDEDEEKIILAQTISGDERLNIIGIPKGCIKAVYKLGDMRGE